MSIFLTIAIVLLIHFSLMQYQEKRMLKEVVALTKIIGLKKGLR